MAKESFLNCLKGISNGISRHQLENLCKERYSAATTIPFLNSRKKNHFHAYSACISIIVFAASNEGYFVVLVLDGAYFW